MDEWKIISVGKAPKMNKPILVEGLPGIGNVGKVAIDFIIEELGAKKIFNLSSNSMPHSVYVNERSLIELPSISIYHTKTKTHDLLLVAGDAQPIDERSTYTFSRTLLELLLSLKGREIITLGGIGLPAVPKKPKIYCTGTSKSIVNKYVKDTDINPNLYGIVGPIIGVSGLLLGLAKGSKIQGVALLAETYGHPMYLGIRGAREIVRVLNQKLSIGIDIKELDAEINKLEAEATSAKSIELKNMQLPKKVGQEASYIG